MLGYTVLVHEAYAYSSDLRKNACEYGNRSMFDKVKGRKNEVSAQMQQYIMVDALR
jgi:hypothetical protein